MENRENIEMNLANNVFHDYDISSLKIFYTILRFMAMDKTVKDLGNAEHPSGYYSCDISIKELARAINFKSRHKERLEGLGQRACEVFEKGIGTKTNKIDTNGFYAYKKQHPIYEHSYENGLFSVKIPVTVFEATKTFFVIEKIEELLKLDDKISFRLYQLLFSNIKKSEYTIHLKHFNHVMGTNYEPRILAKKIKESLEEINAKTDLNIDFENVKKETKEISYKPQIVSLVIPFSRKTAETEPTKELNSLLEKTIEKTMNNRFFSDKYKKNPAQNLSVIYKLSKEFGEEVIINALTSVGRDLAVEIKASLQAYMTKACHNEAENIKISEAQKAEKEIKKQEIIEKEQEKQKADEVTKTIDEQLADTYEKMSDEDKKQLEDEAKKYFLAECEAEKFTPLLEGIFERSKRAYIISVLRGA